MGKTHAMDRVAGRLRTIRRTLSALCLLCAVFAGLGLASGDYLSAGVFGALILLFFALRHRCCSLEMSREDRGP